MNLNPEFLSSGYKKMKLKNGRKLYYAVTKPGNRLFKRNPFKTAASAIAYGNLILLRYKRIQFLIVSSMENT